MARDSGPAHIKSIRDVAAQYNDGVVQQSTSPPASISDLRAAHRREQPLLGGQSLGSDNARAAVSGQPEIPALRASAEARTAGSRSEIPATIACPGRLRGPTRKP